MTHAALRAALAALSLAATAPAATAGAFSVLYPFGSYSGDASLPAGNLVPQHGLLYGLTRDGGSINPTAGAAFEFNPATLAETTIHSFNGNNGFDPLDTPVILGSIMFGTSYSGGSSGRGNVFALNINTGVEKVLYEFTGQADGEHPNGVIQLGGFLYGTTSDGGTFDLGTIYRLDAHGTITTLHEFGGTRKDGASPASGLVASNGLIYGTTIAGGTGPSSFGDGTVFALDPATGQEKTLYSFAGGTDADGPQAAPIVLNGLLYGTTQNGGLYGKGAVYAVNPRNGTETVLHSFGLNKDGAYPDAPVLSIGNKLFGTTALGGTDGGFQGGYGTVFVLDVTTNVETVLHDFNGSTDGYNPLSGLTYFNGQLYGTAQLGGAFNDGTLYSLLPSAR